MFAFPSHHPLGSSVFTRVNPLKQLAYSAIDLWGYSRWLLLLIGLCSIVEFSINRDNLRPVLGWLRANRWSVFLFVSLAGFPISVLFRAKVGSDENSYCPHLYFGIIGILLFCRRLLLNRDRMSGPIASALLLFALLTTPIVLPSRIPNPWASQTEKVYEFAKSHPGEAYFPWYPLPVLIAEGRLYHFEYGLIDRSLGGAPVSRRHFFMHIPSHMEYIGGRVFRESLYDGGQRIGPVLEFLPEFRRPVRIAGFPGLQFYGR